MLCYPQAHTTGLGLFYGRLYRVRVFMEFLVGRDAFMVIHARGAAENGLVAYRLFRACRGGVCGGISVAFPVRIFFVRVQIFRWSIVVFVCLWTDKKQKRNRKTRLSDLEAWFCD